MVDWDSYVMRKYGQGIRRGILHAYIEGALKAYALVEVGRDVERESLQLDELMAGLPDDAFIKAG